jgi:hypothetical protein
VQLIPYSNQDVFSGVTEYARPVSPPAITHPGQAVGLYIIIHPDVVEDAVVKFERWFAAWPWVRVVDTGTSDKAGLGFILMEWLERDVDQLFLNILDDEDAVADYTLYGRSLEE